jgi:plastocyanin
LNPRRLALALAGLLGAAIAVVPSIASGDPPSTGSFTAVDDAWQANGGPGNSATIAPGGTVTFSYPSGFSQHNADFGSGSQPTSCTQTAGANSGAVPPLPHTFTSPGWSGTCTFNTPGTYTFHCDLHLGMTGTVTVGTTDTTATTATETTGTTEATTTSTTTTTPTTPTSVPPPTEPTIPITPSPPSSPAGAIKAAATQHGSTVHGSVNVSRSGAGGRLEVDLLSGKRRVGRLVRTQLQAGTVRFSVPLGVAASHTLRRRGRLTLTVQVIVRSRTGATARAARRVTLISSA